MMHPTTSLSIHPAVAPAWMLHDDDPRFLEIVEDIRQHGILDPIRVTEDAQIVDGRHRWRAAKILGLEDVPSVVAETDCDPAVFALSTLSARRHLIGKGQMAYASYPLLAAAHQAIADRHLANLKSGSAEASPTPIEHLAETIGVGRTLFTQAARLHAWFDDKPELRDEWEPKIMGADPIGLGAALAGIAGQEASTGNTPARNSALARWDKAWSNLVRPAASWSRWTSEERDNAAEAVRNAVTNLPEPLLDVMRDALRSARRARGGSDQLHDDPADASSAPGDYDRAADNAKARSNSLSAEARSRIAAAANARWAKYSAARKPAGVEVSPERVN